VKFMSSQKKYNRARLPFCAKDGARIGDDTKWSHYKDVIAEKPTTVRAHLMNVANIINPHFRTQKTIPKTMEILPLTVLPVMMCILSCPKRKPSDPNMLNSASLSKSSSRLR
jgi:hypothetical protein